MSVIRLPSFGFRCVFFFSPDGTHEWWLLIIHAIKPYLCLLSPVSARKRKREWQRGREWRTEKQRMIKIAAAAAAVATCMYTCTSGHGRSLATLTPTYQTRPRGLTCSYLPAALFFSAVNKCAATTASPPKSTEEIKLLQRKNVEAFFFFFLSVHCYLFEYSSSPITLIKLSGIWKLNL